MKREFSKPLDDIDLFVLCAIASLGGNGSGPAIARAIKALTNTTASVGRIYLSLGKLAEREFISVRLASGNVGGRTRTQTVAELTRLGRKAAALHAGVLRVSEPASETREQRASQE